MSLFNPDESVSCSACGENDFLPSKCMYCENFYCRRHILDHLPCRNSSNNNNRELTEQEQEQLNKGAVSLDSLVSAAVTNGNKLQQQSAATTSQNNTIKATPLETVSSRFSHTTGSALGSALPSGLHRYKRLELLLQQKQLSGVSTCVVYFAFSDNNNNNSDSAVARRERNEEGSRDDEQLLEFLRPIWIDCSPLCPIGALTENLFFYLKVNHFANGLSEREKNENSKISWKIDLKSAQQQFAPFETIEQERRFVLNFFTENNNHKILQVKPQNPLKPMTSNCVLQQVSNLNETIGMFSRVFVISINNSNEEILATSLLNSFWKKHSLGMLPFEKPKDEDVKIEAAPENQQQTTTDSKNNDDDDDAAANVTSKNVLASLPWAAGISRTTPVSLGINTSNTIGSGGITPMNQILMTVGFLLDASTGDIFPNSHGYTLKVNSSWIAGRVIDAILYSQNLKNDPKAKIISLPNETTKLKFVKMSTGELMDENTPIGKYFERKAASSVPTSDAIGIIVALKDHHATLEQFSLQKHLMAEIKDFEAQVQSKKLSKPLMVKSMKDCVIQ